jgi:hypothetical protein
MSRTDNIRRWIVSLPNMGGPEVILPGHDVLVVWHSRPELHRRPARVALGTRAA